MRDSDMNPSLGEVGRQLWELFKTASSEGLEPPRPQRSGPERRDLGKPERLIVARPEPTRPQEVAQTPTPEARQSPASQRRQIRRMLHDPNSLRRAIVMNEILGPPKGLRRGES